jgi:hypothetical protein
MSMSRCILLNHAHIGDQHIPSFVDLIRLLIQDYGHVTLHTPRSCPYWRSTHPFFRRFDSLSTTRLWARHVAYSSIMPTLEINTHLPSSIPFAKYYKIMTMSRCILLNHAHIGDQHILSFVDSIRILLQDYEHVTLYTPRSCPHWRSTHPFIHRFDSLNTTWSWARHVAYSSIIPLWRSTNLPSFVDSIPLVL